MSLRAGWLMVVVCGALSVVVAAMAALNTALPEIAPALRASSDQMTWLIDGYTMTLAALLLPAGAIGDRFGRREILVGGLVVFAVASLLPIWMPDASLVIATRCLAGAAAAFIMPATLSLITSGLPTSKRALGVSIWAAVAGVGAIAGFFVTGVLLQFFGWHSIFVAFAASSILLAVLSCTIATSRDRDPQRFDVLGSVTSAAAVALVVLGLIEAPDRGWSDPVVIAAIVAGVALGVLFVMLQLRRSTVLLDVRLFGNRAFSAGSLSVLFQFFASFGAFYVVLQRLQLVFGYSPLQSAVALFPMVITVMAFALVGTWVAVRFNLRYVLTGGTAIIGVGMLLLGVVDYHEYWTLAVLLVVTSIGIGISSAPATTAIMTNTPDDDQGVGSAVNDTARELGAAIGIAVAGSIVAAGYSAHIGPVADRVTAATRAPEAGEHVRRSLAEALQVTAQIRPRDPQLAAAVAEQAQRAFITPMGQACTVLGGVLLVAAVVMLFLAPNRISDGAKSTPSRRQEAPPTL
ncbi:MFS transporter [Williamsia sterculiae]|nr:MFS transporter [Williamsia sterculiae]